MKSRILLAILGCALALPATASASAATGTSPCRDPWVSQAVQEVKGRAARGSADIGECNIHLYTGQWNSYPELLGKVRSALGALDAAGLEFGHNGRFMEDRRYHTRIMTGPSENGQYAFSPYLGPRSGAPRRGSSAGSHPHVIDLGNGFVMQINRKCAPGAAAMGNGCIQR